MFCKLLFKITHTFFTHKECPIYILLVLDLFPFFLLFFVIMLNSVKDSIADIFFTLRKEKMNQRVETKWEWKHLSINILFKLTLVKVSLFWEGR